MPGITKPVSRLLKLYGECTSELFKQFSNDFNPRAALQRNVGIWAGMQTIQQPAVNRNQTSSQQASEARLGVMRHDAGSTSPSSSQLSQAQAQPRYAASWLHPTARALRHGVLNVSYIILPIFKLWSMDHFKGVCKQLLRKARLLSSFNSLCRLLLWALQHLQLGHGRFLVSSDVTCFAGDPAKFNLNIYTLIVQENKPIDLA